MPDLTPPRGQPGSPASASRNLVVVPRPGDEALLYGALLSAGAGQTWDALLVFDDHPDAVARVPGTSSTHRLGLATLPARDLDPVESSARMRSMLVGYGRIFVPNLGRDDPPSIIAAALAGIAHRGELWARSTDEPDASFQGLPARDLARHLVGFHAHFVDAPAWRALVLRDDPDPWGLAASAYEADRHALELEVLAGLDWRSLVEVGPCRGTFTARLAARFPGRPILAVEPDPSFAASVRGLRLPGVEVVEASALEVEPAVDVLLLACCGYYLPDWPDRALGAVRRFVVTSHLRPFEDDIVAPGMTARGWRCRLERELAPRLEPHGGLTVQRDGTVVRVWERAASIPPR